MVHVQGTINIDTTVTVEKQYAKIQLGPQNWDSDRRQLTQMFRYYDANNDLIAERVMILSGDEFMQMVLSNIPTIQAVRNSVCTTGQEKGFLPAGWVDTWPQGS